VKAGPWCGTYVSVGEIEYIAIITLNVTFSAGNTPLLKDIYQNITLHYAANWKVIGTLLGVPIGILDIIEQDNVYRSVPCCNAMWSRWLKMDSSASWEKVFKAIESPVVSSNKALNKGNCSCNVCVCIICGC